MPPRLAACPRPDGVSTRSGKLEAGRAIRPVGIEDLKRAIEALPEHDLGRHCVAFLTAKFDEDAAPVVSCQVRGLVLGETDDVEIVMWPGRRPVPGLCCDLDRQT